MRNPLSASGSAPRVKAIIDELQSLMPQTKILLLAIFPRENSPFNEMRKRNDDINQLLAAFSDGEKVFYLNNSLILMFLTLKLIHKMWMNLYKRLKILHRPLVALT